MTRENKRSLLIGAVLGLIAALVVRFAFFPQVDEGFFR